MNKLLIISGGWYNISNCFLSEDNPEIGNWAPPENPITLEEVKKRLDSIRENQNVYELETNKVWMIGTFHDPYPVFWILL